MHKLETECTLYRMFLGMFATACEEISDADFHLLPPGGGNSPNWIIGHLLVVNRFGLSMLGQQSDQLAELMPIYGPGSIPTEDKSTLLSRDELLKDFSKTSEEFLAAIEASTVEQLDAAQETPFFQDSLPTTRELLGHLLTTHFAMHFGQLSAWRRGRNYDSLIKFN